MVANIRGFFSYNDFNNKSDVFVKFANPQCRSPMPVRQTSIVKQHGVALIEVMVAFLLLSIALVGFAALQVNSVKATQSSLMRSDASILATNILESMRVNKAAAISSGLPYNYSPGSCTAPGSDGTLAKSDLIAWYSSLNNAFKSACTSADITCTDSSSASPGICTVNIQWDDSRVVGGSGAQIVQLVGRL